MRLKCWPYRKCLPLPAADPAFERATQLKWQVAVTPKGVLPAALLSRLIAAGLPANLLAIAKHAEVSACVHCEAKVGARHLKYYFSAITYVKDTKTHYFAAHAGRCSAAEWGCSIHDPGRDAGTRWPSRRDGERGSVGEHTVLALRACVYSPIP